MANGRDQIRSAVETARGEFQKERAKPQELADRFRAISEGGIASEDDIRQIIAAFNRSRQRRSSALINSLRRRSARRLGPRSGAINTLLTNQFASGVGGVNEFEGNLRQQNLGSRATGLQGELSIMDFLERRRVNDQAIKDANQGSGFLGDIGSLGSIAGSIVGGPLGGIIGGAAGNVLGGGGSSGGFQQRNTQLGTRPLSGGGF